jgi:hypothetical protein
MVYLAWCKGVVGLAAIAGLMTSYRPKQLIPLNDSNDPNSPDGNGASLTECFAC